MDTINELNLPKAFMIGIPSMDEEHRNLVATLNTCLALRDGGTIEDFEEAFNTFIKDLQQHFVHEEKLMRDAAYPGLRRHAASHQYWLEQVRAMIERCVKHGSADTRNVVEFFHTLVADVSKEDLQFVEFLSLEDRLDEFSTR